MRHRQIKQQSKCWPGLGLSLLVVLSGSSAEAQQRRPAPAAPHERNGTPSTNPSAAVPPKLTFAVFGDAFGASAARGIIDAFRAQPEVGVDDRTADDTELTHVDAAAWITAIEAARRTDQSLAAAVVMLGADEDAPLTDQKGTAHPVGTAEWRRLYGERIERVAAGFRDRHVPLIWVGLPNVRSAEDAKTYADLNALYREHAVKGGATFIDVWEPFSDDAGRYAVAGPDVNGQDAVLRRSDGWGFTRAGARVLASFLEADLKHARDQATSATRLATLSTANPDVFDQALQIDINAQIRREAGLPPGPAASDDQARVRPAMDLMAPPLAKDGALASVAPAPEPPATLQAAQSAPKPGRTDDFTWPPRP